MLEETEIIVRVERLDAAATRALQRAEDARRLALDIDRRRAVVVRRDEACVARHTAEVWSSQAATASREELRRTVGFSLRLVGESLRETCAALAREAHDLEGMASGYRRDAALARDELQATRSVSSTSPLG